MTPADPDAPTDLPAADPPRRGRAGSPLMLVAVLVIGLAAGVGLALLLAGGDDPAPEPVAAAPETRDGDAEALAELPPVDEEVVAADEATDPEQALRAFLAAEATGDWATSWTFLSESALVAYPSEALWINAHADFPTIVGYRIDEVAAPADGRASVETLTGFEAIVDPVLGLVPARGRSTWNLVEEDGLWRVEATTTANRPLYPGGEGAGAAAQEWVDTRVACGDTAALEADLVGTPALADALCADAQDGAVTTGAARSLSDADGATALLSEFGPDVFAWARVVPVEATTPLQVVLGPVGEVWQVVGVLPAR